MPRVPGSCPHLGAAAEITEDEKGMRSGRQATERLSGFRPHRCLRRWSTSGCATAGRPVTARPTAAASSSMPVRPVPDLVWSGLVPPALFPYLACSTASQLHKSRMVGFTPMECVTRSRRLQPVFLRHMKRLHVAGSGADGMLVPAASQLKPCSDSLTLVLGSLPPAHECLCSKGPKGSACREQWRQPAPAAPRGHLEWMANGNYIE